VSFAMLIAASAYAGAGFGPPRGTWGFGETFTTSSPHCGIRDLVDYSVFVGAVGSNIFWMSSALESDGAGVVKLVNALPVIEQEGNSQNQYNITYSPGATMTFDTATGGSFAFDDFFEDTGTPVKAQQVASFKDYKQSLDPRTGFLTTFFYVNLVHCGMPFTGEYRK